MERKDVQVRVAINLLSQYLKVTRDRKEQGKLLLDEQIVQDAKFILKRLLDHFPSFLPTSTSTELNSDVPSQVFSGIKHP